MTPPCSTCDGHGEVVVSITGEVRAPKLGEAATDVCPTCAGSGAAPGGGDDDPVAVDLAFAEPVERD